MRVSFFISVCQPVYVLTCVWVDVNNHMLNVNKNMRNEVRSQTAYMCFVHFSWKIKIIPNQNAFMRTNSKNLLILFCLNISKMPFQICFSNCSKGITYKRIESLNLIYLPWVYFQLWKINHTTRFTFFVHISYFFELLSIKIGAQNRNCSFIGILCILHLSAILLWLDGRQSTL